VKLTSKGEARYRELNARFLVIASTPGYLSPTEFEMQAQLA